MTGGATDRFAAPHRLALASLPPLLMRVRQPAKQPFGEMHPDEMASFGSAAPIARASRD
jgi:hypothetical protein